MGISNKHGFTIIEVMLFLAISAALTVGVLVGAGTAISQQRYRDSVNSLASFLQEQYSEVTSVRNDRNVDWTCTAAAGPVAAPSGGVSRGATDCVLLGKYVSLSDKTATVTTVTGRASATSGAGDIDALIAAKPALSDIDRHVYSIEWGASMQQLNKSPTNTTLMILRSPTSGSIRTFISSASANEGVATMITEANLKSPAQICVDPDGLSTSKRFEVELIANASGPTGVKVKGDGTSAC